MQPESKTSKRALVARIREADAVKLRLKGLTHQEIADKLGYEHESGARKALDRAMARLFPVEEAEALRRIEAGRLDALQAAIWDKATEGDLNYVYAVLRVMDRRAKLLGLDLKESGDTTDISILLGQGIEIRGASLAERIFERSTQEVEVDNLSNGE